MPILPASPARIPNGPVTVLLATLLTVSGLAALGLGLHELGIRPGDWTATVPGALPRIIVGLWSLASGLALGLGPSQLAVRLLASGLVAHLLWLALAPAGWHVPDSMPFGVLALLHALWLRYRGDAPMRRQDGEPA